MQHLVPIIAAACLAGLSSAADAETREDAARAMKATRADVRWDPTTLAEGDFNADGKPDFAMVGYLGEGLVLIVRASSGRGRSYTNDIQGFGIGPEIQAAICEAPARLRVDEQLCNPMDELLPGCRPSKKANALNLSGGECDSIHLFWNHKTNRMDWWRL